MEALSSAVQFSHDFVLINSRKLETHYERVFKAIFLQMAAEVAAPFTKGLDGIKMVSTGDGEIGAAKLTGEVR
jgi:hypothetical protein